jgi:EAL domain-containing protein (putative c-di-GMP-specific phosphodiesterase class I)/FixJ family two-component response regulator
MAISMPEFTEEPEDQLSEDTAATDAAAPAAGPLILVVEDHEFQRKMLVEMLESLGARGIHEATDGRVAIEITRELEQPFDIIVTDIDMPDMDGMAFIRNLAKAGVSASLIVISSLERNLLDSIETMSAAYGVRLLGSVEKPATPERLASLIALHWPAQFKPQRARAPNSDFTLEQVLAGLQLEEFEPFFQPKIELATGRVKGAEALVRWRHPKYGIVAPQAFVQLLEANDQIGDLTWLMLAKAAACCVDWRAAGLDLNVSVNLSVKLLNDVSIADAITWQVVNQHLDSRHIILEVTESAAMTDIGRVLENLARLRMKGFGLSIDDYGTGYSSMQQLTRVPFTELKIDQSFVTHASDHKASRQILESSLEMARKLGITSVAEGVETQETWNHLRECGCDLAQGYFIAKPMEAGLFQAWVRKWQKRQLSENVP